jgi:hypothetical protein
MSPRAGSRLVSLGFTSVHDYVPGKVDWLAHGLPCEGSMADGLRERGHVSRIVTDPSGRLLGVVHRDDVD